VPRIFQAVAGSTGASALIVPVDGDDVWLIERFIGLG